MIDLQHRTFRNQGRDRGATKNQKQAGEGV